MGVLFLEIAHISPEMRAFDDHIDHIEQEQR
jgi:hypothetical protein